MKKRILSILLCLCMALSMLPVTALAADYDGWEAATAEGVTLTRDMDTVTIDGVTYTYKGDASTNGIEMYTGDVMAGVTALIGACCWKAGGGYVLYQPTVVSGETTSAEVMLHNAEISATDARALSLPYNSSGAYSSPVPVTVKVEGTNTLVTTNVSYCALYHQAGDTTFTGGDLLSITGKLYLRDAVTIDAGTQVTLSGSVSNQIPSNLTVTGSGSKLTIADGTTLAIGVWGGNPAATVTVETGGVLENNGTLIMAERVDLDNSHIVGEISGSGGIMLYDKTYTLMNGVFYPYGGDVSASGLNLSGKNNDGTDNSAYNAPTEVTRYKAGDGYISYTPAVTGDNAANAKLELHGAQINTTSGRALYLPAEPVDLIVTGSNNLTANGSYNYAIDPNEQAVSITGDGNLTLNGNRGIVPWNGNTPSITINIGGALNIKTTSNPIEKVSGDLQITAKSVTIGDAYGVFCNGTASFEATDGDITLSGGSGVAAVNGAAGVSLKASGKITVDNSAGYNALSSENGAVTVDAQGDVAIKAGSSVAIYFGTGVSMTSDAGSIDVTTNGYTCIQKTSSGTGANAVGLSAAKDITLNADTTAIQTSAEDVNLTAGGKLTSTSAYGFQTRALTINANEVFIEGTAQDGIQASSVCITNPTGGNCKSVSVSAASSQNTRAAIHALGDAMTGNITVKADDLFLCGNDSAKAISANGTVTIDGAGLIVGAIDAGTEYIAAGIVRASKSGGDKSDGLNLSTAPTESTVYTAGTGYALFIPAITLPLAPAKLTLHNATIYNTTNSNDVTANGIALPDGAVTLEVEGTNTISAQSTNAIHGSNTDVAFSGSGVVNVGHKGIALKNTATTPHSVAKGPSVTLNGIVLLYDNLDENGAADTNTVYGNVTLPGGEGFAINGALSVTQGAIMTIPQSTTLDLRYTTTIVNNGMIVNNGTMTLPQSFNTEAAIKALKLNGIGLVKAAAAYDLDGNVTMWDSYTNSGVAIKVITGGLTLTGTGSGTTVEHDGYSWDGSTLTLGNACVTGSIELPDNATIRTTSDSIISGTITGASGKHTHLTFTGTARLSINGIISLAVEGDSITVQDGAQVTANGGFSLGAYGLDGILNVIGSGTTLNISSNSSYAVMCGTVNVQNGASLTVHSEGSYALYALTSGVSVTGGSTLTVGCDYGVYVKNGTFKIDESSTFTANASVAAVCVVDTTKTKSQSQTLNVPSSMLPSGAIITPVVGNTPTYGYTYWTIANSVNTLAVTNEASDPATLSGALAVLTLKKVSTATSTGGGESVSSYILTFETSGGNTIEKLSKTSGTVVDMSGYKPTRDGNTFAGWYSDAALTTKVTSVTLTKNMTVYAKWTEKSSSPFADISDGDYFHDAVLWAVENGITNGTTSTTFSPDMVCTRAQAVTFLWRAKGSPEPTLTSCPFIDVMQNAYYYNAVLWAVEKGITKGTSATTFSPNDIVTRSQSMTFLWRAAGETTSASANPFADVHEDVYYYDAVLWAVEKGVTQGTSAAAFSPDDGCTRAQIVTFLYRYMGK